MIAFAAGTVFGSVLGRAGDREFHSRDIAILGLWVLGVGAVLLMAFLRRRRAARARPMPGRPQTPPAAATRIAVPSSDPDFDRGIEDIRRADPGFDPVRFAGYVGMMFREAQATWTRQDIGGLRDRVAPEMYAELQAEHGRLRLAGRSNHVADIEVRAEVTEAWQDGGQDYVTASIGGSIVDYTVSAASDTLVAGSRTLPRAIDELWTFTRPSGLNFWMLSAIQTPGADARS